MFSRERNVYERNVLDVYETWISASHPLIASPRTRIALAKLIALFGDSSSAHLALFKGKEKAMTKC